MDPFETEYNSSRINHSRGSNTMNDDSSRMNDFADIEQSQQREFMESTGIPSEINETEFKSLFETFILTFRISQQQDLTHEEWDNDIFDAPSSHSCPHYLQLLRQTVESLGSSNLNDLPSSETPPPTTLGQFSIDLYHLRSASVKLFRAVLRCPADSIIFMDEILADIAGREYAELGISNITVKVSLFHHPYVLCMRDLDPKDIETLVSLRGIVIRCSSVIPQMRTAVFRCASRNIPNQLPGTVCQHEESVQLINGEIQEPLQCLKCSAKYSFELFHSRCSFTNKQLLKIQETPESIPEGETPHTVMAYVYDELVDSAKPGDYIELTGIYRASGVRVLPRLRTLKSVYRTYIDITSIHKDRLNRYLIAESELNGPAADAELREDQLDLENVAPKTNDQSRSMTPEMIEKMKEIGNDPNIYEKLVRSLAPNIWECDDTKKGLLCQLFGGTTKSIGGRASRSDIHVLLCGDPSTAKSQLLKYAHGIAPRGVYTCGRGSSAVGLTATVTRDSETKEFVLESGAIVLSDRGICCIDEFDKMDDSARIILHEVMEQQTVSIAKAGIVCSLNARTAILASANPINSRYDTRRSVVDNINLPPSLMSRFDLIYLMIDSASPVIDRALAQHLCQLYATDRQAHTIKPPLSRKTLAHYISYAREYCKPKLLTDTASFLIETYIDIRQRGADSTGKSLSATPRQLESLIRLSEALAKMELSEWVTVKHAKEAVRLMQVATYAALIDPTTGRLDFEQLNAGVSGGSRIRRELLEKILLACLSATVGGLDRGQLSDLMSEKLKQENEYPLDATGRELNLLVRELEEFGTIARIHGGKLVSRVGA